MQGRRVYKVNIKFFNQWTNDMAYILGFLTADGSSDGQTISLDLAEKDRCAVEFVRDKLCPGKATNERCKNKSVRVRVHSVDLCKSLSKLGVFPQKTGKEFLPDMPNEFFSHYLRGVFDGDGWVYTRRNAIECGIVSASNEFLVSLREKLGLGQIRTKIKNKRKTLYEWNIYSRQAEKFRDFIYQDMTFCLSRKHSVFYSQYNVPHRKFWTEPEIELLRSNYVPNGNLKALSNIIGRSYKSVSKKIWELGLTSDK